MFSYGDVINLADCLIELLQGGTGHSFWRKVVPLGDSSCSAPDKQRICVYYAI